MAELSDDSRVLAGGINECIQARTAARNDTTPLEYPAILDDPKADPTKRTAAGQEYAEKLLQRKNLTAKEMQFLATEARRCLKSLREE
jgi:hypothetical protein